jgi:hypothetical protein
LHQSRIRFGQSRKLHIVSDPVATPTTTSSQRPSEAQAPNAAAPVPECEVPAPSRVGKVVVVVLVILGVVGLALLIGFFDGVRHWIALHTGTLHGGPDLYYNFWSGFGADLGEATLITAVALGVYTGVRKVNCHTKGCWRIGHHTLEGTPYILCRRHHPHVPTKGATHEHILEVHRRFEEARKARES